MTEPQFSKVMAKVLSGEATWKEKKKITQWANMSDENEAFVKLSQKSWNETKTKINVEHSDAVFDDILDRIETNVQATHRQKVIDFSNKPTWRRFMYLAAAIALLITTTFIYINQFEEEVSIASSQSEWVQKVNAKGQKLKILLSDGTTVWLNGESRLSYASPFGAENRQVLLSGEAYFDVAHDPNKPFTVKTGNVSTTALGTSFNVQAYKDGHFIDVDLETGKILVSVNESGKQQQVFVDPGEGIRFNKDSKQMVKSEFDPSHEFGWKEGILSFKDADFEEVISKLSRWYGVEFVVKNLDKRNRGWDYTARFDNDYLSSILSGMSFTKNFEYSINNDIVTISFK